MPKVPSTSGSPQTLVHFKVEVCKSIDPPDLAFQVFGTSKHLVVMHKGKKENPHWHFQGYTTMTSGRLSNLLKDLSGSHSKRIGNPNSRPIKQAKNKVDELGFQYMMKEDSPHVVTQSGFTPEDLDDLHEASKAHVKELQNKVYDWLCERIDLKAKQPVKLKIGNELTVKTAVPQPRHMHRVIQEACMDYYMEKDIMWPPNLQKLILYYMLKMARQQGVFEVYKEYVATKA